MYGAASLHDSHTTVDKKLRVYLTFRHRRRATRARDASILYIMLVAYLTASASAAAARLVEEADESTDDRPNLVLVLQDDMDLYMGGWTPMKQTTALVSQQGATASNWFIHTPVCCPSRGELLSGRYFHNIRMPSHKGGCMHIDPDKVNGVSFAAHLETAGYANAYFGKHLNDCPQEPPPGFGCPSCYWFAYGGDTAKHPNCTEWVTGGKGCQSGGYFNSAFFDYDGGVPANVSIGSRHSNPAPGFYQADAAVEHAGYSASIVANKSIAWLKRVAPLGRPWMLTIGNRAPHQPFEPAPWYAEGFPNPASTWIDNLSAPRTPDYNASCPDFHWLVSHQDIITPEQAASTDDIFRNRWRATLSVDDGIAGVVGALVELGVENRTYLMVTSDHGWNLGQHRLPGGKHNVYDHSVRIPFVIRGPGIEAASKFSFAASNVDVAPTLLGLAGLDAPAASMDGRSVAPLLVDPDGAGVLRATRQHVTRHWAAAGGRAALTAAWRTVHPIEFAALNNHTWFGHLVDDLVSNTYRALRFVADPVFGDLLYAEFTAVTDWDFAAPVHFELFNMTTDPHQLTNLYAATPHALRHELNRRLLKQWTCAANSSNPCP
tara:strand:+ start:172 stop:1983 length:1812 start_codon:yes stop_codon:yes gene_type:complete